MTQSEYWFFKSFFLICPKLSAFLPFRLCVCLCSLSSGLLQVPLGFSSLLGVSFQQQDQPGGLDCVWMSQRLLSGGQRCQLFCLHKWALLVCLHTLGSLGGHSGGLAWSFVIYSACGNQDVQSATRVHPLLVQAQEHFHSSAGAQRLCQRAASFTSSAFLSRCLRPPPFTLCMLLNPTLFSPSPPQLLRLRRSLCPGSMRAPTAGCPWGGVLRWTWAAAARCGTGWCVASAPRPPSPTQHCAPGVGRASPSAPPRQNWSKPGSHSTTCWPGSLISYRYLKKKSIKGM